MTAWGGRGVQHRRCTCSRSTPPAGVLTTATADLFVAGCRAAQLLRDAQGVSAGDRSIRKAAAVPASSPQGALGGAGAGLSAPGTAQTISGPRDGAR